MDYPAHEYGYGKVPSTSTGRIHPAVRPEGQLPTVTILPPTTRPQPMGFTSQRFETFEAPRQDPRQPYRLANEQPPTSSSAVNCPMCFTGINFFKLPQDPTASVFCGSCRQPYHFCPVHKVSLPGMGLNMRDPAFRQCQCQSTQGFLNDDSWNSCFNK
jgi:hypothetical protein